MSVDEGSSSDDDDDDDFNFESSHVGSKRYPVHDCCEYEDAESLKRLIFVPQDASSDDENGEDDDGEDDSSSDDNDSLAAALAAAIGHSPQPIDASQLQSNPETLRQFLSAPDETGPVNADNAVGRDKDKTKESKDPVIGSMNAAIVSNPLDGGALIGKTASNGKEETGQQSEGENASSRQATVDERTMSEVQKEGQASHEHVGGLLQEAATGTSETKIEDRVKDVVTDGGGEAHSNGITAPVDAKRGESKKQKKRKKKKNVTYYSPYDLNERDEDENTPLHVAIHACKLEHVKLLLEAGASSARKCDGSFPIHTAISMGSIPRHADFSHDCVALLVGHGADLSLKDDLFHSPLYLACVMNLPRVVSFILSDTEGMSTLNGRSDRSGGRPLHAAAKSDIQSRSRHSTSIGRSSSHISDESLSESGGLMGSNGIAQLTQMLLSQTGVEVDAQNMQGHTPLHVACCRGNWPVARLLLKAHANPSIRDKRGFSPMQWALKRGLPIPNDLVAVLGNESSSVTTPRRDLIVDPDSTTLLISHELCMLHRSCQPIRRDSGMEPPPENIRRLHVLVNENDGILRGFEFSRLRWQSEARRAAISDVLRCHEYEYVEKISHLCSSIPDHPAAIAHLDPDTAVSRWSFEAALRAAGSVCEAVDKVVNGEHRNAFCAVRPPGHHAGPRGIVRCPNDPEGGSHGFCLLNNVAIGAAYARSMYRHAGIRKIAIVDFDVHHGNGTEEIIRQLVPTAEKAIVRAPFAAGELTSHRYRPWLDESDVNDVFFASIHGYGPRGVEFSDVAPQHTGWFYPASGKSQISDSIVNPSSIERPNLNDFLLTQTWSRMGEENRFHICNIINCGLGLPDRDAAPGLQRLEVRNTYRTKVLPRLREFDPDIIFISAGFDGHRRDTMNFGYVGMVEEDYEWLTEQLVKVANSCCNGRIVSVLEGGYKVHGGIVSPFARSVASHVRGLVDGAYSREMYDASGLQWETEFEGHLMDDRERKRQQKHDRHVKATESARRQHVTRGDDDGDDERARKRRRSQVDYKELYQQMKREGTAT